MPTFDLLVPQDLKRVSASHFGRGELLPTFHSPVNVLVNMIREENLHLSTSQGHEDFLDLFNGRHDGQLFVVKDNAGVVG